MKSLKIKPPNTTIRKILSLLSNPILIEITPIKKVKVGMINPYNNELKVTESKFPQKLNPCKLTKNKNGIKMKILFNFIFILTSLF